MPGPAVEPAVAPAAALAAWAESIPETPFLFHRGPRGHFTWWSWRAAREAASSGDALADRPAGESAATKFLRRALELNDSDREDAAALLAALPSGQGRPIWLTHGDLSQPVQRVLTVAALAGGWAIVHEPGAAIHPETFAWARPTVVGGSGEELLSLIAGFAELAPRWRRRNWTARRLRRLAAVVTESDAVGNVRAAMDGIGGAPIVLSIPACGW